MLERTLRDVTAIASHPKETPSEAATHFLDQIHAKIGALHAQSRHGLWNIVIFLICSMAALLIRDIHILDYFSESVRQVLGAPPAPFLIHIVLAVSTISGLIIIGGRLANDAEPGRRWEQLGHRTAFYFFYFFSNALNQYFLIIFLAGLAVLLLEHYHIWSHYAKAIRHEQEMMKKVSLWPLIASESNK